MKIHRPARVLGTAVFAGAVCLGAVGAGQPAGDEPEAPAEPGDPRGEAYDDALRPEAAVLLRDGREVRGLILDEDDSQIVLRVGGLPSALPRRAIVSIRRIAPALDRYETMRVAIPDHDVEALLALADWLVERRLYKESLDEINRVLAASPGHPGASRQRAWLDAQLRLRRSNSPAQARDPGAAPVVRDRPDRPEWAEIPVLTSEQINLIRVYEIDLNDPPRLRIDRELIDRLLADYAYDFRVPTTQAGREALYRESAANVVELMFGLQARELYPSVRVLSDPASLKVFRERVHSRSGWLVNACATIRCHGGTEAGRLALVGQRPNSDATVYTNFYILDTHQLQDGTPLINEDEPARSPLLHMAMRRENSLYPHPEIEPGPGSGGWKPIFRDADDSRFKRTAHWIRMLYRPRPDYGIEYDPGSSGSGVGNSGDPRDGDPAGEAPSDEATDGSPIEPGG